MTAFDILSYKDDVCNTYGGNFGKIIGRDETRLTTYK